MQEHDRYREMCALMAIGELSPAEESELKAHLQVCEACRAVHRDFSRLTIREVPLAAGAVRELSDALHTRASDGFRQRFLQQARGNGIRFSDAVEKRPSWFSRVALPRPNTALPAVAALALIAIVTAVAAWREVPRAPVVVGTSSGREAVLLAENRQLRATFDDAAKQLKALRADLDEKTRDLAAAQEAATDADKRVGDLETLLAAARANAAARETQLRAASRSGSEFQSQAAESARLLAEANQELQKARAAKSDTDATLVAQQVHIQELSEKLRLQTTSLDMDKQLMAASRDVRELMGARNLHIMDVRDVGPRGKDQAAFGRIFYTEGKSLIFYAFDLGDPRVENAKHSFQVWGQRQDDKQSVKNLGLFYLDDKAQHRWALKVDDPHLLAQIDSVFVTVEPAGGRSRPSGEKMMYAYLNTLPNHP